MKLTNSAFPRDIVIGYTVGRRYVCEAQRKVSEVFELIIFAFFVDVRRRSYDRDPTERAEDVLALGDASTRQLAHKFLTVSDIYDAVAQGL